MAHACLTVIRHEHRALSAMLRALVLLLGEHRRHGTLPDFGAVRAMLFYVDEFPERLHHPKESRLLFPKLRGHSAHLGAVLDRLEHDHARGAQEIREIEHLLLGFEMMSGTAEREARRTRFEDAVNRYVDAWLDHMRTEETQVLPVAEAVLGAADWAELDAAFLSNRDPLIGYDAAEAYRPLFRNILQALHRTPGIGAALEALAGAGPPSGTR